MHAVAVLMLQGAIVRVEMELYGVDDIREFRITLPQNSQSQRTADVTGTLDYQAKTR